jgi:ribosomal protein S30
LLKGSIKASVEDSVETLQSGSLKEAGRRRSQGPTWQGVWYVKGEREFVVTKERKPRPPRLRVRGVYVCVGVCERAGVRARARGCASIFDGGEERTTEI